MDKIKRYQQLTKHYLTDFANLMNSQPVPNLETVLSFDDDHQQYLLLKVGWTEQHRTRHILLHTTRLQRTSRVCFLVDVLPRHSLFVVLSSFARRRTASVRKLLYG